MGCSRGGGRSGVGGRGKEGETREGEGSSYITF